MAIGPVQMLIVGFEDPKFQGEVLEEFKRLKDADIIRLIDLVVVKKDDEIVRASNSSNATSAGSHSHERCLHRMRLYRARSNRCMGIANRAVTAHLGPGNQCALVQSVTAEFQARRHVLRR